MTHARVVGSLYSLVRERGARVDRVAFCAELEALVRHIDRENLDVHVVGEVGSTMRIREAVPVVAQLANRLAQWVDGPAPAWLVQNGKACAASLGWHTATAPFLRAQRPRRRRTLAAAPAHPPAGDSVRRRGVLPDELQP